MVECRTLDARFKPKCGQKENLSQVHSQQYHHQTLFTRVKYLKLSEVKTRSRHGTVVECRTRDPRFKAQCVQKENLSQVQSEQYPHQSLCTRVKYLKLSEVKTRSRHGTVVECRTRDPRFKPQCVQKENLSLVQLEQYYHQSLCTRVKYLKLSEVKTISCCGTVVECRLEIQSSRVQTPVWPKRKSLKGPIRTIPPPIPLYQS